jgi:methylthioxylose transferase
LRRGDVVALAVALGLITVAAVVGEEMKRRGVEFFLPRPPLLAYWHPHVGWGTPLAIWCLVFGLRLQRVAVRLAWRRLLLAGWLLNMAWMCSLALVDGLQRGWIKVLLNPNEYLHDIHRIADPATFMSSFTHYVAFGPGVGDDQVWTTHVAGHPPLATLVFWLLDRIGLGGGFWAGALCILVGSAASVTLPLAVRELGADGAARRVIPFVALFPGAVWMAVSADGLFAGVAISGLALLAIGATRGRPFAGLVGGLLVGIAVFLSYGLLLFGLVVLLTMVLTVRRSGLRSVLGPWLAGCVGFVAVIVVHLALGFNWLTGLAALRVRYDQGIASQRPYSYFVYADLAAWLISCSPLLAVGVARSIAALRRRSGHVSAQGLLTGVGPDRAGASLPDRTVALLAVSGVLAALVADLSGMSKAETERIWLSFGLIAYSGLALLRGRIASPALLASAIWALLVNHLLNTGW